VEALLAALGDESVRVRASAAWALAESKAASEPVIAAVRRALERAGGELIFVGYRLTSERDALFEALWRLEEVRAGLAAERTANGSPQFESDEEANGRTGQRQDRAGRGNDEALPR